jgi:hypothetical protein
MQDDRERRRAPQSAKLQHWHNELPAACNRCHLAVTLLRLAVREIWLRSIGPRKPDAAFNPDKDAQSRKRIRGTHRRGAEGGREEVAEGPEKGPDSPDERHFRRRDSLDAITTARA